MSPEQALGEAVDQRTDIFSLGVVLFEMITGKLPFAGATSTAMALQIVQSTAPAPSTVSRSLPKELDAVVGRALAKRLDGRYESAATFAAELRAVSAILEVRAGASEPANHVSAMAPRRRSSGLWIAALAIVIAGTAAGWWQLGAIAGLWHRTTAAPPAPVIAVIPLEPAGADASRQFFADGLTEDLITRLGQTPGLRVLGRSATRTYRSRSPRDVAKELGAAVVMTGTVRPLGDQVRITLELTDPDDGLQIWTGQYTREVKDIFAIQAQVASEVAQALRVKLQPTAASERTSSRLVDQHAYELYLRGRQATAERRLPEAITLYDEAIKADAGLSEAFAGLAEALHLETAFNGVPDDLARRQRRKDAAARSYQLDPDLPQANLAMALSTDALPQALGYLRRAIEIDPSFTEAYHQIGDQIIDVDTGLAVRAYRRSLEIDPRFAISHVDLAAAMIIAGRWDDARREIALVPDLQAAGDVSLRGIWQILIDLNEHRFDRAIPALHSLALTRKNEPVQMLYIRALRSAGRAGEAFQEASRVTEGMPLSCDGRAIVAGLRLEHGQAAAAHQAADPIVRAALDAAAAPTDLRCGAVAAAAMADAPLLAGILDRIGKDEAALRYWTLEVYGETGRMFLQGRLYPFNGVVDRPPVVAARKRMDAEYERLRGAADAALTGLF